ncbi:MAG: SDR family oxidoreductase [Thermodesulfobacteriota bacterium]|nr:SDR family oxidoreductase [Thermodesulfobacteriota bacterium]
MDLHLAGKNVIVLGGASNIRRAISMLFAEEKANVLVGDWDEKQAEKTGADIKNLGVKGRAVKTDVTDWDSVQNTVKKGLEEFGSIDILVNNAGWAMDRLFVEKPRNEWEQEIAINYWGVINGIRAVLDHMIERKQGSIVSIGSDAGRMGEYREAVYAGCKGGIIALTKAIARENGRFGIRLNVVCPGLTPGRLEDSGVKSLWRGEEAEVFTPEAQERAKKMYPLRKLGTPEDIANAVVFIASSRAGHITGQTLSVSGGYTMM